MTIPSAGEDEQRGRVLRVGLIGCGKMGMQHLKAIAQIPGATVVGIADPAASDDEIRPLLSTGTRIVPDAATLLQEIRPDVVHIVTPPATHAHLALEALRAGCHVYVEKPFAETLAQAKQVLTLASERNLKIVAGHQVLFEKPALEAAAEIGRIGRLVHVESHFSFRMVRRTISAVDQCKDILPHAVYPLVQQLRISSKLRDEPFSIKGVDARPSGDVYALLRIGECTGILEVSLNGRPVEQYQNLVGTNGSLRADYISGCLVRLIGPGAGIGVLFTPYRRAFKSLTGASRGFARLIFGHGSSYPGLQMLVRRFYASIATGAAPPMSPSDILDTVDICERLGQALTEAEEIAEEAARQQLAADSVHLPSIDFRLPAVLVTGGTGMLGRPVAMELRNAGFRTRVLARRIPAWSRRVPGVEYVAGDLAMELPAAALERIGAIVHCAAETAGGKADQERNSIAATRNVLTAAQRSGVKQIVHVSSLAVLKPGREAGHPLNEQAPVDADNPARGPYVWGKAQSELEATRLAAEFQIPLRIIRPGPLVDYKDFSPPGRLGREVGPWFVAIGSRKAPLAVCDVWTAARVIRSYLTNFDAAPSVLNMIEGPPPTREHLVSRLLTQREDLRVLWVPDFVLRLMNGPAKLAQKLLLRTQNPIDIHSAFASERYCTDLAAAAIKNAGPSSVHEST
jgi:predicted dehydrogenase/nucleoside-diphosphate-sugar epimerase